MSIPNGCKHHPPCPTRRACVKYAGISDRQDAALLMAFDDALRGLRSMRHAAETLIYVKRDQLSPLDEQSRLAGLSDLRDKLIRASDALGREHNHQRAQQVH